MSERIKRILIGFKIVGIIAMLVYLTFVYFYSQESNVIW